MVDILQLPVASLNHARLVVGQIELTRPWGSVRFCSIDLAAGWYWLRIDTPGDAVCLQMSDMANHQVIELSALRNEPAFAFLPQGTYHPELFAGIRPGAYEVKTLIIEPLPDSVRYRLFARRALNAIRAGTGLKRLFTLATQALQPRVALGVRAGRDARTLGVLAQADLQRPIQAAPPLQGPTFLVRYRHDVIPMSDIDRTGLSSQTYTAFTLDPATPHDIQMVIGPTQTLTADALALFAMTAADNPEAAIVIADCRVAGVPTARVAFDPLLYDDDHYPAPYAVRPSYKIPDGPWARQQPMFAVINVPLADGDDPPGPTKLFPAPPADQAPLVSIIIPTRDRADLLSACVKGLFDGTPWPHEVIIVDNGSIEAEPLHLLEACRAKGATVLRSDAPFNFSALCNMGAEQASGDYLVFMNNDIVLSQPDWLARMMAYAIQPDVGAVGARLLYADKRLQHGGVALGLTQLCGHLWRGLSYEQQQQVERLNHSSLRAAVTAALMCVAREKFEAVGGFDEELFPVTLNDVDLCLKLYARGWFNVYAADVEAFHLEGESRGADLDSAKKQRRQTELDNFVDTWASLIDRDPWLPASVARSTEIFRLK